MFCWLFNWWVPQKNESPINEILEDETFEEWAARQVSLVASEILEPIDSIDEFSERIDRMILMAYNAGLSDGRARAVDLFRLMATKAEEYV